MTHRVEAIRANWGELSSEDRKGRVSHDLATSAPQGAQRAATPATETYSKVYDRRDVPVAAAISVATIGQRRRGGPHELM